MQDKNSDHEPKLTELNFVKVMLNKIKLEEFSSLIFITNLIIAKIEIIVQN